MQNLIDLMVATHGVCTDAHKILIEKLEQEDKTYQEAKKQIDLQGIFSVNNKGDVIKHPAVAIQQKSAEIIKSILAELKLTPKSVTHANQVKDVPKTSPMSAFAPVINK